MMSNRSLFLGRKGVVDLEVFVAGLQNIVYRRSQSVSLQSAEMHWVKIN